MAKQVYTIGDKKIKAASQSDAERLYQKDFGTLPKGGSTVVPADVITDPVTGKSFSRDRNNAGSVYQPYVPPVTAPKIDVGEVANNSKLTIPPLSSFDSAGALVSSYKPLLESTKNIETASKERDLLQGRLGSYYEKLATKGDRSQAIYDEYQIPQNIKKIQDMTMALTQRSSEFDKMEASLSGQGRGISLGIITGQQGAVRRQKAVEIGAQAAVVEAMKGNVELSSQLADRAIDLEFSDIETNIDRTLKFLELNREKMSEAQKEQADELNLYLDDYKTQVTQKKQDRKDILAYATEVAKAGYADVARTLITTTDIDEAERIAAPYVFKALAEQAAASNMTVREDGYGSLVAVDNATGNVVWRVGGFRPTGSGSGGGSTENAKGRLADSTFVSRTLEALGLPYEDALAQIPPGMVGVIDNATGNVGFIPPGEFDSSKYTKL